MELEPHQRKAALHLYRHTQGGAVWHRVGTGKTRTTYFFFAIIAKQEMKGRGCNFLVVCRREAFQDWTDEIAKSGLNWKVYNSVESDEDLNNLQINPPLSTVWLVSHGMLAKIKDKLLDVAAGFQAVCYDEGYLYKNSQTKHCKAAHRISERIGRALILSGSIMTARNLEDIYGQLYAVDRSYILGETLTKFRSQYRGDMRIDKRPFGFAYNRKGAAKQIRQRIKDRASLYFPDNNSRRIITAVRTIPAGKAQSEAFRQLRQDYWLNLENEDLIIKNAPTLIIKCQQISDGWIKMPSSYTSVSSLKLNYLVEQVHELISSQEKVVVWCAFKHTVKIVLQRLQKEFPKVGCYPLTGGTQFDRNGWNKNGRICIGTEASGSSVNFLKDCSYAIYYSMGFRWLDLQQSMGRTNRHDSKHSTCFYDFLQTEGGLDSHVYKIVQASSREEQKLITINAIQSWLQKI